MIYYFYDLPNLEHRQTYMQYSEAVRDTLYATQMEFSACGKYLAIIDSEHGTIVFKQNRHRKWGILGKTYIHKDEVLCIILHFRMLLRFSTVT